MKVGITGHQKLEDDTAWDWVKEEILSILARVDLPLIGLSSLAAGADQIFAQTILECGGNIEVVLPFSGYKDELQEANLYQFELLLSKATHVVTLAKSRSEELSYLRAGEYIVDHCEFLIAVWDGEPAAGVGGTGDIVVYARKMRRNGTHLNPLLRTALPLGTSTLG